MNVVFTLSLGDGFRELGNTTHPTLKNYADKCGADFLVIDDKFSFTKPYSEAGKPHWAKLGSFRHLLEKYEKVLYIDTDIIIRDDAPNLFEQVEDSLALFKESQFTDRKSSFIQYMQSVGYPNISDWKGDYYNTGVILANKSHAQLFVDPPVYIDHFYEQSYLNLMIEFHKAKVHSLHYKFNRMSCMDQITGEPRHDCFFLHYAGLSSLGIPGLIDLIKSDMAVWEDTPNYKFKKNIAVMVEGGLGDQIAAEPTVRYIKERIYPDDTVIVCSDWPELFEHCGVPVYKPTDKVDNYLAYHKLHTMRNPEHESWKFMSHPLIHCVDFASMQAIRLQLPAQAKRPKLPIDAAALESIRELVLENTVLVHPGKGWFSKTFPADIWQSYIDALVDQGSHVVIIGKRINEEQGVVELDTSKCLDLTDKLTLKQLIALISLAPALITNDSSPVHIAGAFDNWIGLISTCKNPEHILHLRHGSIWWKARALEREKLYEDFNLQPTMVYGVTIDKCSEERLRECLPTAENVVNFIKETRNAHSV